ncbi:CRISPR-associated helicase Cas3' [Peptoniphilus asaccharolyticus]
MKKQFLAKSKPIETIQEHTDNLLRQLEKLKDIYPEINVNWALLEIACIYHDLGKMNDFFQYKIRKEKFKGLENEVPHGILSACFLDIEELSKKYSPEQINILYAAVYFHHHRSKIKLVDKTDISLACANLEKYRDEFEYDKFKFPKNIELNSKYMQLSGISGESELYYKYVMLKGLLNKIDYSASAYIDSSNKYLDVELKNDFLEEALSNFMSKLAISLEKMNKGTPDWNELQKYMMSNQEKNLVVIAQTGMGKTEAGLWWIGNNKGFFTLPIRTAINAIYDRVKKELLDGENFDNKVGVLHSGTKSIYLEELDKGEINNLDEYFSSTRQLSLPLTICTLDQLFTFVFLHRNYESKLATLSYSKIIIDEIQMYSADLVAYLIRGLKMIQDVGGKYAILTATFPGFLKKLMKKEGLKFEMPEKDFVDDKIRHSVAIVRDQLYGEDVIEKYDNNRVLIICNTVKKCQEVYQDLENIIKKDNLNIPLNMLHAKYIKKDKECKTKDILKFGKLFHDERIPNTDKGIWITSSIAEASLDIDFDILLTELSEVSGLFQRFGRCYRKREWTGEGYNCYVYDGGDKKTSGIGNIIDKEIFNLSKKYIREFFENNPSTLSEINKMKLVEEILSMENVRDTDYYQEIKKTIEYIKNLFHAELSKEEAQKNFRNILSETIIPKVIYKENIVEINEYIEKLKSNDSSQYERLRARNELLNYTLDIETRILNKMDYMEIDINRYEKLKIVDCNYDFSLGFRIKEKEEKLELYDNFF